MAARVFASATSQPPRHRWEHRHEAIGIEGHALPRAHQVKLVEHRTGEAIVDEWRRAGVRPEGDEDDGVGIAVIDALQSLLRHGHRVTQHGPGGA